jgi:hypothetical protein
MSDTPNLKILQEATNLLNVDGCTRIIELSAVYGVYHGAAQTFARLRSYGVELVHLSEQGKPRSFQLSSQEADVFVAAWTQYQLDYAEATASERAVQEQAREEAFAMARELPVIQIHDSDDRYWWVEIPVLHWQYRGPLIERGSDLLIAVKAARKRWAEHILFLRESLTNPSERWESSDAKGQAAQAVEQWAHLIPFATDDFDDLNDHPF